MKTVPLHDPKGQGRVALVDDDDYELVSAFHWMVYERGNDGPYAMAHARRDSQGSYYPSAPVGTNARLPGRRTTVGMHKLITGWPRTDHRNHDGLDNQRANLRPASTSENDAAAVELHGEFACLNFPKECCG